MQGLSTNQKPAGAEGNSAKIEPSAAAKALVFDPVQITYSGQGSDSLGIRFVMDPSTLPVEASEENLVGLPVYGYVVDKNGQKTLFDTKIVKYEPRSGGQGVITVASTDLVLNDRGVGKGDVWALMIFPYGTDAAVKAGNTNDIQGLGANQKPAK